MTHCPSLTARLPASLLVAALACGGLGSAAPARGGVAARRQATRQGVDVARGGLGRDVAEAGAAGGRVVGSGEGSPAPVETVVPQVGAALAEPDQRPALGQ